MGFFSLPFGVKVSGSDPLDAERYIKDTLEDRNALFDAARTYVGLQCFVGDTLYIFKGPARDNWDVIGIGGPGDPAPEDTFIYGQADGAWKKVTGLQALDAGSGNISLGVIGEDPAKHRAPAEGAVDMSIVPDWDTTLRGTNSPYSFMAGEANDITSTAWDHTIFGGANLIETGSAEHACTAIGAWNVISKGYGSTALGAYNHVNGGINGFGLLAGMNNSSGNNAHGASAIGIALSVDANSMTAVGASNVVWTGDRDAANRPIFSVGIGTYTTPGTAWEAVLREDGFNVLADGSVIAPNLTNALIDTVGAQALITKDYFDANIGTAGDSVFELIGTNSTVFNPPDPTTNNSVGTSQYSSVLSGANNTIGDGSLFNAIAGVENTIAAGTQGNVLLGSLNEVLGSPGSGHHLMLGAGGNVAEGDSTIHLGFFGNIITNSNATSWVSTDKLLVVGNGQGNATRSDALIILKDGTITAPSVTNTLITTAGNKALITKEYLEENAGEVAVTTEEITATVAGGDVDPGDIIPLGTNLTEFIKQLLAPVLQATIQQSASASITNVPAQTVEIGTALSFTIAGTLNRGLIDSKDSHPDVALVGTEDPGTRIYGGPGVDVAGNVSTTAVSGSQAWSLTISYTADNLDPYYNSSGEVGTNLDGSRGPGSVGTSSGTTTGRYKMWWDTGLTEGSTPTASADIRSIVGPDGGERWAITSGFSITVPLGYREISFYMPSTMSLNTVVYSEYNADVTSTFNSTAINVDDAGGASISYTKYTQLIEAQAGYPEIATYVITLQ